MSPNAKRVLIVVAASLTVAAVGWVLMIGSVLAWSGIATVRFAERGGVAVTVPIPMAAVEAAVSGGALVGADRDLELGVELGEWAPLAREVLGVLDDCPDAVLVEVEDGSTLVRVEKRGGDLQIRVRDSDLDLRVSVPTRSVTRTAARLIS